MGHPPKSSGDRNLKYRFATELNWIEMDHFLLVLETYAVQISQAWKLIWKMHRLKVGPFDQELGEVDADNEAL